MLRAEAQTSEGSLYTVLKIPRTASTEQVREAYKKAAKRTHPDIYEVKQGEFEEVNKAYTILTNKKNRLLYNAFGDSILPILLDLRYAPYIETFLCKQMLVAGLLLGACALLSTVFYPYLALMVGLGVLPYYTATLAPHCVTYGIAAGIACRLKVDGVQRKVLAYACTAGLGLSTVVFFALYLDGLISAPVLACMHACIEILRIVLELGKSLKYLSIAPLSYVLRKTTRKVLRYEYVLGVIFRGVQCALLVLALPTYIKALPLAVYVFCFMVCKKGLTVSGVALSAAALAFSLFTVYLGGGSFGVVGWVAAAVVFSLKLFVVGRVSMVVHAIAKEGQWGAGSVLARRAAGRLAAPM
ncbi:uncharacterized protein NEMAJ01_0401 [Nematocida major]|uniref:uncharacterized protein n=1 Tax=Nematocida major TaxID=1912982 RepID=UPI002008E16F|nr:uncharacterized protein NEMAJ01_0401 [Nematocida major]KAH9385505.1 hypothetical protein NEMAJ01_0401 [Nematocida major]